MVGRDAAAWIMALGLTRALHRIDVKVRVVELPSLSSDHDAYLGLPSLAGLHEMLGLPEATMLKASRGVPVMGQRFVGWSADLPPLVHGYDVQRAAIDDVDFLQFWVKAQAEGMRVALEDFSLAAAAAKQGRIDSGKAGAGSLGGARPGYHLDARGYVGLLRGGALHGGMTVSTGALASVEREGNRIAAVVLDGGERIEADLFIDATGAEAALIGAKPGAEIDEWSWFGSDRRITASLPATRPLPGFAQVTAFAQGWVGQHPLRDRTAVIGACAAEGRSDEEMIAMVGAAIGATLDDAVVTSVRCGARPRAWIGNCVAVGDAAATLEPIDAVQLYPVQVALSNLVALWPVTCDCALEATAYNRVMAGHLANMRDFQAAHYRLNGRAEPFWARARGVEGPPGLDARLSLFAARGQVPTFDDEVFATQSWSAIFVGHGVIPRRYDPAVDQVPVAEQMGKFQRLLRVIANGVTAMPTVEQYIAAGARA